jgi:glycosyltransferase involved in cell wall biosynthesis
MKKISLVIDSRAIRNSGIGVYLQKLLPHILESGNYRISLLGKKQTVQEAFAANEPEVSLEGITIIECGTGIYTLLEQAEIPLKVPQSDIFWSPHYNIPLLPIRARHRVVTIHDVYHLAYLHTLSRIERLYARTVIPLAARLSEKVITVSAFSKSEIVKYTGIGPEKIEVIHNGVDSAAFRDTKRKKDDGVSPSDPYLLYVGNVKPHKNVIGLINAFVTVRKSFPDVKLVIVGKRDHFIHGIDNLDEYVTSLGIDRQIVFTGFVGNDELCRLYKNARVFVFPSFYEGFGLPPLEAMASGVPVVVSRSASLPEVCGDAAMYVDPHNPQDIARGIIRVLREGLLINELVDKGLVRAAGFSWKASAEKHMKIFEAFCATR